jgi:YbbR domain-containing protein
MKSYLLKIWGALSHNFGLKLLALVSAFLIWVGVVNSQDPVDTITFYNIPVEIVNEEALIQKDKIPEVVYGSTVTVTIQARKSICDALTADSVKAIADFEKIYVTDTVPIEISVKGYDSNDVEIIRGQNSYMKLTLEDYATKEFKVRIETKGTPADGYVVGYNASSPNVITIRGSKLQISRIQGVVATVNVEGLSAGREVVAFPVVYDMNDEEISKDNLELSADSVNVSTTLYKTRTINLEAITFGDVAEGYEIKSVSFQPSSIQVAGTTEDLMKLGTRLRAYVDVTGLNDNGESNIDINSLIDSKLSSIMVLDDDNTLAVTVYVGEKEKVNLNLMDTDVSLENVPAGMKAELLSVSPRRVTVRAAKDVVKNVTGASLNAVCDLSGCRTPGIYDLPLIINEDKGVECLTDITVRVEVTAIDLSGTNGTEEQR